jgi:AcrR family transcriptional regulator
MLQMGRARNRASGRRDESAQARRPTPSRSPGRGGRQRLDVKARREQLVTVAKGFFAKRPYDAVKVDEIATAAGVSEGLVYHYFPTKRELYVAVIGAASADMAEVAEPDPGLPPLERLAAGVDAYIDYVETNAEGYRTVHQGGIGADPEVHAIIERSKGRNIQRILDGITVGAQAPEVLRLAVRGWLGFMEAVCLDWLQTRNVPREELRDLFVAVLITAGLTAWPQDARPPQARIDLPPGA